MDAKELAAKMLEYSDAQVAANSLRAEIEAAVLELEKTLTVGNVKATYRKGRKTYDYKEAADGHVMVHDSTIALFTSTPEPRIDWRKICKHVGIDDVPFTQGEPSVSLALID